MTTELTPTKKDHFKLIINGVEIGEVEKSELREHMEKIDNTIL